MRGAKVPRPWGRKCLGQLRGDLRTTPHEHGWKSICLAFLSRDAQSNAPLLRPRTESRLSTTSTLIQPLYNRFPTPRQPSGTSTSSQPTFNRHANASQSHPRRNRFPITFQPPEADKRTIPRLANIHDSTILHVESESRTIPTQPSSIRDSPTQPLLQPCAADVPRVKDR